MPIIQIPSQEYKFSGLHKGEIFGNIWASRGIDFEREKGKIMLGDSFSSLFNSSSGDTDLTTPVAFLRSSADGTDRWWVNGGKLFKTTNTNPETGWTQDAIGSSPTAPLYDLIDFAGAMLVPTSTNIDRLSTTWTTNWWTVTAGGSAMTTAPHRMSILAGALLITDGRFINTWDGTLVADPDLTLPAVFESYDCLISGDFAYIYGRNTDGTETAVYTWDRTSTAYNDKFPVGDVEVLAGFVVYGIPHIITKKGEIKRFTGQGFRTVQQFPNVELGFPIADINPRGVVVDNNIVKILVRFGASSTWIPTLQSQRIVDGIWTFDAESLNLTHTNGLAIGTDYSQGELTAVGAMKYTNPTQGRYLVGARAYTVYTETSLYAIFSSDEESTSTRGYFITPKIPTSSIRAFFKQLQIQIRRLDTSSDRVRVLYRIQESNALPAYETITWASSTTFTAANSDIVAGNFVEVIAGPNAGAIAKISTYTGGTVTLDLTLNSSTSAGRVRYLNFIDLGTISSQTLQNTLFRISRRSEWIQFLIELRGTETSPQFERALLDFDNLPL